MNSHTFRSAAFVAALLIGAAVVPSSLAAQGTMPRDTISTVVLPTAFGVSAPTLGGPRAAPAGITRPVAADSLYAADRSVGMGSNLALMGVGAAALVVGLMVGGDGGTIIALSGGVLGLVGLYRYLR